MGRKGQTRRGSRGSPPPSRRDGSTVGEDALLSPRQRQSITVGLGGGEARDAEFGDIRALGKMMGSR